MVVQPARLQACGGVCRVAMQLFLGRHHWLDRPLIAWVEALMAARAYQHLGERRVKATEGRLSREGWQEVLT